MLVDSHCHLDYFNQPGEQSRQWWPRAKAAGVGRDGDHRRHLRADPNKLIDIAEKFDNVWACVGVHPNHAADVLPVVTPEALAELAQHPKVIGIGESGLDYFYDKAPKDIQAAEFPRPYPRRTASGLPLCIHARDADDDIVRVLSEERAGGGEFGFLLHCFSSSRALGRGSGGDGRVYLLLRHAHLPQGAGYPRHRQGRAARAAAGGNRLARISPPCPSGASATSRPIPCIPPPCWPSCVALPRKLWPISPPRQFPDPVPEGGA